MDNSNQNPNPPQNTPPDQPSNSSGGPTPQSYRDWREQRRAERWAHRQARWQRHAGRPYGWFGGAVLIVVGLIFLLQTIGITSTMNWWALFLLIPAFWAFVAAWNLYQYDKQWNRAGVSSLVGGVLLILLAFVLLLNVNFGPFWPILLIAGGVILLGVGLFPSRPAN